MTAGGICFAVWPLAWLFSITLLAGALCYPVEGGRTAHLDGVTLKKKLSREILRSVAALSGVFVVLYAFAASVGHERGFLTAVLFIGALGPAAERDKTWRLWALLSVLYAAAWAGAGYFGPEVLWPAAFVQLVVCGGVKPVLAAQHYIT